MPRYRAVLSGFHIEPLHQEFVFPLASLLWCLAKRADRARACWESGARSAATFCAAR
jgi:hypothetical protein